MGLLDKKTCTKCGMTYPATLEFFNRKRAGMTTWCKVCVAEYDRSHRAVYPRKYAVGKKAWAVANVVKVSATNKAWRDANPAKVAELGQALRAAHPERFATYQRNRYARQRGNGGSHTAIDIQAQYDRQKGRCFWCQEKVGERYEADHVVPLIEGGSNGPENIVVACPTCNRRKGPRSPMDFAGVML